MNALNIAWMWDVFSSYSVEDSYRKSRGGGVDKVLFGLSLVVFSLNLSAMLLLLNGGYFKQASVLIACNLLGFICSIRYYIVSKLYEGCLCITEYTRPDSDKNRVMPAGYLIDAASDAQMHMSIVKNEFKGYLDTLLVWFYDPRPLMKATRAALVLAMVALCFIAIQGGVSPFIGVRDHTSLCLSLVLLSAILKIRRANKLSGYVLERQFALNTCRSDFNSKEFVFKRR